MFWVWWFLPAFLALLTALVQRRWQRMAAGWMVSAGALLGLWAVFMVLPGGWTIQGAWVPWFSHTWAVTWNLLGRWDAFTRLLTLAGVTWATAFVLGESAFPAIYQQTPRDWLMWWLGLGLGLWLLTPATPAALWWAWAMADLAALLWAFWIWPDEGTRFGWMWHITARAPTWLALLAWTAHVGYQSLEAPEAVPAPLVPWLLVAVSWRVLWNGPVQARSPRRENWARGGRLLVLWLGLGSTVKLIPILASQAKVSGLGVWAFWVLTLMVLVAGGVRLLTPSARADAAVGWWMMASVVALWAAWFGEGEAARFWVLLPWTVLPLLVTFRLPERRLLPLWGLLGAMLLFLPFTPGHAGMAWLAAATWPIRGLVVLLWAVLVLAALPVVRLRGHGLSNQARWVQAAYPLGMAIALAGLARWGWTLHATVNPWAWGAGPIAWVLALGLAARRRQGLPAPTFLQRNVRFFVGLLVAGYRSLVRSVETAMAFLNLALEGRSALMWALAFLMALVLYLSGK